MIYGNYFLERYSFSKFKFIDIDKDEAKQYLESYYDYKKYKNHIDLFKGEICIDKEKDKLAGIVMVYKKKYSGFITPLEVMKEYRGQGLGKKLLKDVINKYGAIDLVVDKTNKIAISLYKKNGFITLENPDNKSQYYMKLKSKVSSKDKIINEATSLSKYTAKPISKEIKNKYKSQFKEIIHTDEKGSYAWFDGDELVAFAYVKEDKGKIKTWMHLSNIFVNPKYRSQGIGDTIVKFLIDKHDIKELGVLKTNTNAINLYKKNGFKIDKSYTEKYPDSKYYYMIRK